MPKNLNNLSKEIDDFFEQTPTANQKAWGIVHQFYHLILSFMEDNDISRAELARRLGKSRASISQLFNSTPNISIKKMIEILDCLGLDLQIDIQKEGECIQKVTKNEVKCVVVYFDSSKYQYWNPDMSTVKDINYTNFNVKIPPQNQKDYFVQ